MSEPLSPADILLKIERDLAPWVAARKGRLSIAADPGEILEALGDGPRTFRIVLNWAGDDDQTGQALAGITTQQLEVWIIKAKGLKLIPGDHLVKGDHPFLQILSDVRAQLRNLTFPDGATDEYLLYKGAKQLDPELALYLPTTGYKLSFELTAAIPHLTRL